MISLDEGLFFDGRPDELELYERLVSLMREQLGPFSVRVQKTQISFSNRYLFACVSFARVKRKAELPPHWLVLTFCLPSPKHSDRIAVCTEAAENRFTHHAVIGGAGEADGEMMGWLREAYDFAADRRQHR